MRHAQAVHGLVQAVVHRAVDQAIRILHGGDARQTQLLGHAHKLVHTIRRFVGQTNGAHFAGADQATQRFQLLLHRDDGDVFSRVEIHLAESGHVARGPVDLVEVDHIGFQALERSLAGLDDVCRRQAIGATIAKPVHAAWRACQFGGQHQFLARARVLGEPVANDGFSGTVSFRAGRH